MMIRAPSRANKLTTLGTSGCFLRSPSGSWPWSLWLTRGEVRKVQPWMSVVTGHHYDEFYHYLVSPSTDYEGHVDHRVGQELHVIVLSRERVSLLQEFFQQHGETPNKWINISIAYFAKLWRKYNNLWTTSPTSYVPAIIQKGQSIGDNRIEICTVVLEGGAGL